MVTVLESMIIDRKQSPHRRRCGKTSLQNPSAQCFPCEHARALKHHLKSRYWPSFRSEALRFPPANHPILEKPRNQDGGRPGFPQTSASLRR